MVYFVDTEYVNKPTQRRSTTGFYFVFYGSAVLYRSKNQYIDALISMESELIYAVTYDNNSRFLRYMLRELGFPQDSHTTIYEGNDLTIDICEL